MDASKPLDFIKHEEFAQRVVTCGNQSQAYREVFQPTMNARGVWVAASQMANRIDVSRRIDWLRAQSLERAQISVVAMIHDLHDIATADPGELMRMLVVNCRHCHGPGFKYQWLGTDEYAAACERIAAFNEGAKAQKPLPDCEGGFDYDPHGEPNPLCPHCLGVGSRTVWVADTTTLSGKARKLYRGVKVKGDGSIEILAHDQLAARDQLHKLLGAYKTDSNGGVVSPPVPTDGAAPKAGDASVSYMAMIHGGRKAAG